MINKSLIRERLALIKGYLDELQQLRAMSRDAFLADKKATGAAESYLRRSLEAAFDIGRHILAKTGATDLSMEYKSIARGLVVRGITDERLALPDSPG